MNEKNTGDERLGQAYRRMLERLKTAFEGRGQGARLQNLIEEAKEKAVELGELTEEEAERMGDYLRRDLKDAATFMSETGKELRDWLSFDLEIIEDRLLGMFSQVADQTRLELDRLALQARTPEELHTGEVTGMGTLRCTKCGEEMRFKVPGRIPPCPKCHGTTFVRVSGTDQD